MGVCVGVLSGWSVCCAYRYPRCFYGWIMRYLWMKTNRVMSKNVYMMHTRFSCCRRKWSSAFTRPICDVIGRFSVYWVTTRPSSPRQLFDCPATWRARTCHPSINVRRAEAYWSIVANTPEPRRLLSRPQAHRTLLALRARGCKYDASQPLRLSVVYLYRQATIPVIPTLRGRRSQARSRRPSTAYQHRHAAHRRLPRIAYSYSMTRRPACTICTIGNGVL
jgi:hypothetical protein